MYDPEERLAEDLTKEGGGRWDGEEVMISKMYDLERLAEDLTKEGVGRRDGRRDGRPSQRRINNK
jgi:hypothetical protein